MLIKSHRDLEVYKIAFDTAINIFDISKDFPTQEQFSLTSQIRRSARSVCANLAEAFRKRKYEKHFISKISDCEAEAGETQVWLEFCLSHKYINQETYNKLFDNYEHIISMLVKMQSNSNKWTF
ncbi:MAG: four helix bundle protein [Bacteroidales bacterium]|nr:four helix bundle protein [Bacteroidales bacterium]